MRITTQEYNDITIAKLQGDLDAEAVEQFQNIVSNIIAARKAGIVLAMEEVGYIDSEGLERLLWARDYCTENTCQLRLACLDSNCSKILEITRLKSRFDCYEELAEAVKSFA
jgi:anti-anti-sigma factor